MGQSQRIAVEILLSLIPVSPGSELRCSFFKAESVEVDQVIFPRVQK